MDEARPHTDRREPVPPAPLPAAGGNLGPALDETPYQILERIGRACFGDLWHGKMAECMGESDREVRRWRAGHGQPSPIALHRARMYARVHARAILRSIEE